MEDRVYNRWSVLQRETRNGEAEIKDPKEGSEKDEGRRLNSIMNLYLYLYLYLYI